MHPAYPAAPPRKKVQRRAALVRWLAVSFPRRRARALAAGLVLAALAGCSSPGTRVVFDLDADYGAPGRFYDAPWPSDLRTTDGHPDTAGWPNPRQIALLEDLKTNLAQAKGFPVMPVAWMRFTAPLPAQDLDTTIAASPSSPILLVELATGRLVPVVAETLPLDDYTMPDTLAIAPRPGFVLRPQASYAFVVLRSLGDAAGKRLDVPAALASLAHGHTPSGTHGAAAKALYAPLWPVLRGLGIDPSEVAAATVFTTGDVVAETAALSEALLGKYPLTIDGLQIDPDDGAAHPDFCELVGTISYPQFQHGTPPFNTEGLFDSADGGLPSKQRDETAQVVITIPKGAAMPAGGWPLVVYWHGSGGDPAQVVDRGAPSEPAKGYGPAHVLSPHGFAMAASALPLNPQRLPGASDTAYLNLQNLAAFRDTFRQGVIEQRMFIAALRALTIPASVVAGCGLSGTQKIDATALFGMGQSMGGMYTNMIVATEPALRGAVPTGAGGFWSYFILHTSVIQGAPQLLAAVLGTDPPTFVHPGIALFEAASEPAEPMVYMPRLGARPLPGYPVRPVYEPVGKDDSYFPMVVYDAVALAYQHREAGDVVWPTMQDALGLEGLDGILDYPVANDRTSEAGGDYTGVVVQYAGDGQHDSHSIFSQLDAVKYQYGCFFETLLATGTATVPAPAPLGTPCPR